MSDPFDGRAGGPRGPMDGSEEPESLGAAATLPVGKGPRGGSRAAKLKSHVRRPRIGLGAGSLVLLIAFVAVAALPVVKTSLKKTPRDRVGISYGGGPFEGAHFQRVVQPGSSLFFNGWFDPLYLYPADQQNYIISKTFGQGIVKQPDSVIAPTKDRVQVEYQVAAFFKLNIDRLRAFHEQLGLKYQAYTRAGWVNLLQDTFRQQIESSLQQETRRYTVEELVSNATVLIQIQNQVQRTITEELIKSLGQQYFCGPDYTPGGKCGPITFVIKKIDPPTKVQDAFNGVAQRQKEAESIDVFSAALGRAGPDYVLLRAIESGAISFWVVPNGTDLTLQSPGANGLPGATGTPGAATTTTQPSQPGQPGPSTTAPGGGGGQQNSGTSAPSGSGNQSGGGQSNGSQTPSTTTPGR